MVSSTVPFSPLGTLCPTKRRGSHEKKMWLSHNTSASQAGAPQLGSPTRDAHGTSSFGTSSCSPRTACFGTCSYKPCVLHVLIRHMLMQTPNPTLFSAHLREGPSPAHAFQMFFVPKDRIRPFATHIALFHDGVRPSCDARGPALFRRVPLTFVTQVPFIPDAGRHAFRNSRLQIRANPLVPHVHANPEPVSTRILPISFGFLAAVTVSQGVSETSAVHLCTFSHLSITWGPF
jgi:hypothetical protein